MLRYFVRQSDIACAERDTTAKRLLDRGYAERSREQYVGLWREHYLARRAELAAEDAQTVPAAPLVSAPLGNGWTKTHV